MKRKLAISDIHGHGKSLLELLKKAAYSPEQDQLVLLGDYIHKGPDSLGTLEIIHDLKQQGALVLRGNHEEYVLQGVRNDFLHPLPKKWELFLSHMSPFETDDEYIYVHAGIRSDIPLDLQSLEDLTTIREDFIQTTFIRDKRIVFGHTVTHRLGAEYGHIWWQKDKIGIDTGAGKNMFLSLVDLTNRLSYRKCLSTGVTDVIRYNQAGPS